MNKAEKSKIKQQFEKVMDNRDNSFKTLEEFEKKYHMIPEKYQKDARVMAAYAEYKRTGGWRKNGLAVTILNKAIKKAIKSTGIREDNPDGILKRAIFKNKL